jgi:hypothetical protein
MSFVDWWQYARLGVAHTVEGVLGYVGQRRRERQHTKDDNMAERKASDTAVLNRPLTEDVDDMNGTGSTNGTNEAGAGETGTDGTQGSTESGAEAAATASKAPKRNLDNAPDDEIVGITVRVPNALRKKIGATALEQKTSSPQLLATMIAEAFDYKLPTPERAPRLKRYDSPEDRKNAQKRDQQRSRLVARKVLESVEKGVINVDMTALLAEVDAELAANAAKAAEAAAAAPAPAAEGANTEGATVGATS